MATTVTPGGWGLSGTDASSSAFVRALSELGHGVLIIDGERITEASEAFSRLVERSRESLLALPSVFDLVPADERAGLREALTRYAAGERVPDRFSLNVVAASGNLVPLDAVVKSIDGDVAPPRLLIIAQETPDGVDYRGELTLQQRLVEAIADAAIDGILVVDIDGQVLFFNQRFVEMWRVPRDAITGRHAELAATTLQTLVSDRKKYRNRIDYLYSHPREESRDEIQLRDGRIFDRYSATVLDNDGEPRGRVWFYRDVSDSRRDQETNELLARAAQLLGSSLEYEATLRQICGIVVPTRADWAAIDVIDETGSFRRVATAHVNPRGEELLHELDRRWPLSMDESRLRGRAVSSREPVALYRVTEEELRNVARDEEQREMLRSLGMRSAIWVPLIARERVLGVLSVGYGESRRRYGAHDLKLMRELAGRAALAVDNALLYREVERAEQRQAAVAILGQSALSGMDIDKLLGSAAERVADVMDVPYVEVLELMPEAHRLLLVAGVGWRTGLIGHATVDAGHRSQGGYTVTTVGPVVLEDLATEQRFRPPLLLTSHAVVSGVTVVIGSPTAPWGVLGAHSDVKRRFADDDVAFVQAIANVLGAAIERRTAEDKLNAFAEAEQARAAELKAVIESMGDAVVVSDARGDVVLANPAAEALLGRRLRQGLRAILRAFEWPAGAATPETLLDAGSVELQLKRPKMTASKSATAGSSRNGSSASKGAPAGSRWMELSGYPVQVGSARASGGGGTILIMRDVTATRDARAVRDAFIGILSHELRTPVTTIYGGSEVLARSGAALPESVRREVYDDIRAESDRLYRLVENLLVLSRVEREGLAIEREPILLQRLLPRVVNAEAVRWPAINFKVEMRSGLPPAAAEETYVEQVVRNLLTNAAKYGGPSVVVQAEATESGAIKVTVRDEGPGFREGEEERLFEIFYRSPLATRRASGAGIGLFVSQQLVRAMGGRIWAANRPEGGAEFGFELPVFAADL